MGLNMKLGTYHIENVVSDIPAKIYRFSRAAAAPIHNRWMYMKNSKLYDQEIPQSQPQTNPWPREEEPHSHHETP